MLSVCRLLFIDRIVSTKAHLSETLGTGLTPLLRALSIKYSGGETGASRYVSVSVTASSEILLVDIVG